MKSFLILCGTVFLAAVFSGGARADQWDKKTIVTLSEPVEVPGAILQPGKYVIKLMDSPSNRNIVRIMNDRENHVFTTALTVSAYRTQAPDKTVFTFYEMPHGQPDVLNTWFYPGDTNGQQFLYSKQRAAEIAMATRQNVPVSAESVSPPAPTQSDTGAAPSTESGETMTPSPAPPPENEEASAAAPAAGANGAEAGEPSTAQDQAPPPQPPPATDQPPATDTAGTADRSAEMPKTAGNTAVFGLLGFSAIALALAMRLARRVV